MKFDVGMASIEAEVKGSILVIRSSEPLTVLSSAVLNGGLVEEHGIINVQVPEGSGEDKNDEHWNAEAFLKQQAQDLGLPDGDVVGLMTAAKMKNVATANRKLGNTALALFVTAGTTVAVTAGEPAASKSQPKPGTINIILLVNGNMTDGCMVEAHKTITEAKTVALRELDLRSQFSGDLASGTLTDTVAVACTKKGEPISFAGTFTLIGELIAQCVRQCVKEAIHKQENFSANRPLTARLAERGLQTENLLALINDKHVPVGTPQHQRLVKEVERSLADEKIALLVLASLRFDDDLSKGLLPANGEDGVDQAAFEEIVLSAIRGFNGKKDRSKANRLKLQLRNEQTLGPFTTCVLEAILKNAYSTVK
jgi:adenosylcobinamide amidohydrolase